MSFLSNAPRMRSGEYRSGVCRLLPPMSREYRIVFCRVLPSMNGVYQSGICRLLPSMSGMYQSGICSLLPPMSGVYQSVVCCRHDIDKHVISISSLLESPKVMGLETSWPPPLWAVVYLCIMLSGLPFSAVSLPNAYFNYHRWFTNTTDRGEKHVDVVTLGNIILIPNQSVFAPSPEFCMPSGETKTTIFIYIVLGETWLKQKTYIKYVAIIAYFCTCEYDLIPYS